jgi:Amt family ammonium transporter
MHMKSFLAWVLFLCVGLASQQALSQAPAAPAAAAPEAAASASEAATVAPAPVAAPAPVVAAPAPAASAPAPLTHPSLVGAETLNGADTAWMMTSTALVLLMTLPGIALFYGGMVRKKSVLNVMACVIAICAVVSLLWFAVGYSIAFTPGSGALGHYLGGTERLWFTGLDYVKDAEKSP